MLPATPQLIVKHFLTKGGYSTKLLAKKLRVSRQTIYRIKNGEMPSHKLNQKLIELYLKEIIS